MQLHFVRYCIIVLHSGCYICIGAYEVFVQNWCINSSSVHNSQSTERAQMSTDR